MFSSPNYDVSALWTLMWGWIAANSPAVFVALLSVVLVLPVLFLATKIIARASSESVLAVHRGANGNAPCPAARSAATLHSGMKVLQEVRLVGDIVRQSSGCLLRRHSKGCIRCDISAALSAQRSQYTPS